MTGGQTTVPRLKMFPHGLWKSSSGFVIVIAEFILYVLARFFHSRIVL
jgi:hypothetical protein